MAYLGNFTSGSILTAAEMNQLNGITFCTTTAAPALVATTATNTTLTFTAATVDVGPWFTPANNRITPTIAGVYMVTSTVTFAANAGAISYLAILLNGATLLSKSTSNLATSGANSSLSTVAWVTMNGTTDYLTAVCYHTSGVNNTVNARTFGATLLRKT